MSDSVRTIQMPPSIERKLGEIRVQKTRSRRVTWIVGGLAFLLLAMGLAMGVDRMLVLFSPTGRATLTFTTLATVFVVQVAWWVAIVRRGPRATELAAEVDGAIPQLEERWSTVAEIVAAPPAHHQQVHRGMMDRLAREAVSWERRVQSADVVSFRGRVMAAAALGVVLALLVVALAVDWSHTSVLLRRFWSPMSNISATHIVQPSGNLLAARDETCTLTGRLQGDLVSQATIFLKADGMDDVQRVTLFPSGDNADQLSYRIKAAEKSFSYRFRAGDGQTDWYRVTVADRPELAEARLRVVPPAYTKQEPIEFKELPHKASMIEGSRVEIALRPRGDVDNVTLRLSQVDHASPVQAFPRLETLRPDTTGWFTHKFVPRESLTFSPVLTSARGLENRHPPTCLIDVHRDQPPTVGIVSPEKDVAVRANDTIDVRFKAQDDLAVSKAELVVFGKDPTTQRPVEIDVIAIPLGEKKDSRKIEGTASLDLAKYKLRDGDELSYAVRVYDNHRTAASTNATAERPPARPAVVAPADHSERSPAAGNPSPHSNSKAAASASPPRSGQNRPSQATSPTGPDKSLATPNADEKEWQPNSPSPPSSSSSSRLATNSKSSPEREKGQLLGTPPPANDMNSRMLDVGQCSCSGTMKLQVDRWASSYASLQRQKLEIALAPDLQKFDELLAKAEDQSRRVLDQEQRNTEWTGQQHGWLGTAEKLSRSAKGGVDELRAKTDGTPYAFIGLQLSEIVQSHVAPARESFWSALHADANSVRYPKTRLGWEQVVRARERLHQLTEQFERIRREHRLADATQKVKTMYRVFLEDSFAVLNSPKPAINRYDRKLAQMELDEAFLKRVQEILAKRRELMAELSRILAEDPRLLRRFADKVGRQTETLRDQLTLLALQQQRIERELRAHHGVAAKDKKALEATLIQAKLAEAGEIAAEAAQMHERFGAWLPSDLNLPKDPLAATRDTAAAIATAARELHAATVAHHAITAEAPAQGNGLAPLVRQGRAVHGKLQQFDTQLRALAAEHSELSSHVVRRLAEVRHLFTRVSAWAARIESLDTGQFSRAWIIEEYALALDTDKFVAEIADIEERLADVVRRPDGTLPPKFSETAQAFLAALNEVKPHQLATCVALQGSQLAGAVGEAGQSVAALSKAERLFDELMRMAIDELDRRPIPQPVASELQDPTLDELLAKLKDEGDFQAALGIPCRPSNLQIVKDWLSPGNSEAGSGTGNVGDMLRAYLKNQQQQADGLLQRAYEGAVARATGESGSLSGDAQRKLTRQAAGGDWNVLVSKLENELLQGRGNTAPEAYRRAIEQYFDEISRANSTEKSK